MKDNPYRIRTTRLSVLPEGDQLCSEMCTHVTIKGLSDGELLEVTQQSGHIQADAQTIIILPAEWDLIRQAIDTLMNDINEHGKPA